MHSISLYHLRAYNSNRKYSDGTHYAPLDDANGKDLVNVFKKYVSSLVKKDFKRDESEKSVLSFMPFTRLIHEADLKTKIADGILLRNQNVPARI